MHTTRWNSRVRYGGEADWLRSVEIYRDALEAFRRALAVQAATDRTIASVATSVLPDLDQQLHETEQLLPDAIPTGHATNDCHMSVCPLTPRQHDIASLIARGLSNRSIAEALVITRGTVANHVADVLGRLGVHTRTEVAVWAIQHKEELRTTGYLREVPSAHDQQARVA